MKINKLELTVDNVVKIYEDCLFKEDEIIEGRPTSDFTIANGIRSNIVFNTAKINQHKNEIAQLIDMLPRIDEGESFLNLCNDKNGNQWADFHQTMEQLVQLGIASEILNFLFKKEMWNSLPGGVPYVIRNKNNINNLVIGKNPIEFPIKKRKNEDEEEKKRKNEEFLKEVRLLALENFKQNYSKVQPIFKMLGFEAKLENEEIMVYDLESNLIGTMEKDWVFGGTVLKLETNKGELSFTTCFDGKSNDNGEISRNIVNLNNLEQNDENIENIKFTGKHIGVELGIGLTADSSIPRIDISVIDPNAENIITEFSANSYSFKAELENAFGPYGNYIDGTHRSVCYENRHKNPYIFSNCFTSYEKVENGKTNYLKLRSNDDENKYSDFVLEVTTFENNDTEVSNFKTSILYFQVDKIVNQLLTIERTKNLIDHVLNSINNTLPGMKDYIMENFNLMKEVKQIIDTNNHGQGISSEIKELVAKYSLKECDLPIETRKKLEEAGFPRKLILKDDF